MATIVNIPQGGGTGSFLVSEAHGYRSRESITVAKGAGKLPAGTVLGRLTAAVGDGKVGEFVPYVGGGASGAGVFAAICYEPIDATAAAVNVTGVVRDAEIQRAALVFATGNDTAAQNAAFTGMAALGLALR